MDDASRSVKDDVKGLISKEMCSNEDIPYADDFIEMNHVKPNEKVQSNKIDNIEDDIPYADDFVEMNHVCTNSIKPSTSKDVSVNEDPWMPKEKRTIHATDLGAIHTSPNSDTIVVDTPEGTLYITLDPDCKSKAKSHSSHSHSSPEPTIRSTTSTDISRPSTSKAETEEPVATEENEDKEKDRRKVNLRRNSISMPALSNLEMEQMKQNYFDAVQIEIPEHHQSAASGFSDGENTPDENVLSEDDRAKSPLRPPRRKSTAPRRLGRSHFSMDDEDYSPNQSVTSINSIASLLREKIQNIPQKIRKKPTNYILIGFVITMFIALALYIGFAYALYRRQAPTKSYFDNVKWNEPKRQIRIYNQNDVEIFRAKLAVDLPKSKAFPCLPEHRLNDGSICLEWTKTLRFHLKTMPYDPEVDNTTCYNVYWKALKEGVTPNDCFDWGEIKANWYGGSQALNLTWPLNIGSINYTPFITGNIKKSQFSNVIRRYFLNSKGAAVIVDEKTPLHVAVNSESKELCIKSNYDDFAYVNKLTEYPEMKYIICTSTDMNSLHASIHDHQKEPLWHAAKKSYLENLDSLISEPVWEIAPRFKHELVDTDIKNFTRDVVDVGYLLINELWQSEIGDLTVDTSRFENMTDTIDIAQRRGFKTALTVQPFISTESKNFAECVMKRFLVSERNGDRRIPALTRFKSSATVGVIDVTNEKALEWFLNKLYEVKDKHKVHAFYLDLGTANDLPYHYQFEKDLVNPDEFINLFTMKALESELNIIGMSSAITLLKPPTFVSFPRFESTWEDLRRVIPTILTYGIDGYPFIMPGAVGGDIYWPGRKKFPPAKGSPDANKTLSEDNNNTTNLPDKELYMRWLQLATFLPVIRHTHMPSMYNDDKLVEMAKNLTSLRNKMVTGVLKMQKRIATNKGLPLIRPLWMLSSNEAAMMVQDEFAIGDELIVAPVLHQGMTTRDVYLPVGLWQDGIDGSLFKGNRWLNNYRVPLNRVAFFIRRPDDLRI